MDRRQFVKNAGMMGMLANLGMLKEYSADSAAPIRISRINSNFEREKLVRPLGFKGGYLTELWQTISRLQSDSGISKIGLATQSVLYGDAWLFENNPESEGNALMYVLTNKALDRVKQTTFTTPIDLLEQLLPEMKKECARMTGKADLHVNYVYNTLVSIDHAAWLVYAAENRLTGMDQMIPPPFREALGHHHRKVAIMYQIPYGMPPEETRRAAAQGYFVFKIKAGSPGSQAEMLKKDMDKLSQVHHALKEARTTHTASGKLIYTMDANGRYEKKEMVLRYLDHARKIGAFDQILLFEEPFVGENEEEVGDMGIRIAGDESMYDEESALRRLQQGYGAIVLKGIAKTLSLSLKMARLALQKNVPCICADLTVNPILIDWHKNLACRLPAFPGLDMGLMETNGDMNYLNWNKMRSYHPRAGASWMQPKQGVFELNDNFYSCSGGIFDPSPHYENLVH